MAEGPRRRLYLLSIFLIGATLLIVAQLFKVQVLDRQFYTDWGREQRERSIMLSGLPRGVIRDRNGSLLAGNTVVYAVEAAPAYVVDAEAAAADLESWLHMPAPHLQRLLESDRSWVSISRSISKQVGEEIAALQIPGVTVRPKWVREYPEGELAAHVLGFCNGENEGFYGVEGFYDEQLKPVSIEWEGPVDPASEQIPWVVAPMVMPQQGYELVLTLDRTMQALVEEELARSLREFQAQSGTIIVMDPRTFEVLALASAPGYHPQRYVDFFDQDPPPFEDPAVSLQYEPGSVFKVLTLAIGLDSGLVAPETTYYDAGHIEVGGQEIRNASRQAYGNQTMTDMLVKSLNVGAAWLSTRIGTDTFYRYLQAFGIGHPSEVDLAGEVAGQLWLPGDYEHWHDSNLGTNAFGQGLAVTPMQMIAAVATIANDGARLRPHVVAQRVAPDGSTFVSQPVIEAQVVTTRTARVLTEMMVQVVEEGVPQARVPGYRVAGKTGTAQIPVPGGYDPEGTIASFVGFGPLPDPEFIILIKLDRPQSSPWGSQTAAKSFRRLAERLFVVAGLPPEDAQVAEAVR